MEGKQFNIRLITIGALMVLITLFFLHLTYQATIVNAVDQSESAAINNIVTSSTVAAARGNITDRYGRVLVTNKTEYVVTLNPDSMGEYPDQVSTIRELLQICSDQGVEWTDSEFPISQNAPYSFTSDSPYYSENDDGSLTETRLAKLCDAMKWTYSRTTTAEDLVNQMKATFGLSSGDLSESEQREILGVLYSCYLRSQEIIWTTYDFAEDVNIDFISVVKEHNLRGVTISATATRQYTTDYAASLLGQVGAISAESWSEKKDSYESNGYSMDSIIGLSGAESAFEQYLRGIPGKEKVVSDTDGNILSEEYTTDPQPGNNVALTIDIKLQEECENALSKYTEQINNGAGGSAAVVIDCRDGSILAAASYPTYSAADYNKDYKALSSDKLKPLFNRAFLGTYAPGSTYKMCTATAAANNKVIGVNDLINCTGSLKYGDTTFHCWRKSGHGEENLADAVRDSCNVYFYTVGSEVGIDALTSTAQAYGLGVASGVELSESTGVNAGPAFSASIGATWYPGNTLSAAIGQSDNQFTPLQLANYIATFANGGTRYAAHLLKSVKNSDNTSMVYEYASNALDTVDLSSSARDAIKTGMGEVIEADSITAFDELQASGIKVACKTGTAQTENNTSTNGLFVAFAPYDDPEIAVCVVVEKAEWGANTAVICSDIMQYYFSSSATLERANAENQLVE